MWDVKEFIQKYQKHNISSDRLDINGLNRIMSDDNNRKPQKKIMSNLKGHIADYSLKNKLAFIKYF